MSLCECVLLGGECVPRLAWGGRLPPCCLAPGETCMAASWAAYNCCMVRQTCKERERQGEWGEKTEEKDMTSRLGEVGGSHRQ